MWIDVKIPYEPGNRLADAYNRALEDSSAEWVLLLDHDVFLACNKRWYEICQRSIKILNDDDKAAMLICYAGGEHHLKNKNINNNIDYHIKEARNYYEGNKNQLMRINEPIAGFFMLVKRKIALEIGFRNVKNSINNIDIDFCNRFLAAGYKIYRMESLYVYHRRRIKHLK